jgi:hypothetical protein
MHSQDTFAASGPAGLLLPSSVTETSQPTETETESSSPTNGLSLARVSMFGRGALGRESMQVHLPLLVGPDQKPFASELKQVFSFTQGWVLWLAEARMARASREMVQNVAKNKLGRRAMKRRTMTREERRENFNQYGKNIRRYFASKRVP